MSTPTPKHAAAAGVRGPAGLPRLLHRAGRHRASAAATTAGARHTATGAAIGPATAAMVTASAAALCGVALLSSPVLPKLVSGDSGPHTGGAVAAPVAPSFVQPTRDARQPITLSGMVVPAPLPSTGTAKHRSAGAAVHGRTAAARVVSAPPADPTPRVTPATLRAAASERAGTPRVVPTPGVGAPFPVPSAPGPVSTPFQPPTLPPTAGGLPKPPTVPPTNPPTEAPRRPGVPPTATPPGAGVSAAARTAVAEARSTGARVGTLVSDAVRAAAGAPEPDPSTSPAVTAPGTVTHTATATPPGPAATGVPAPRITAVVPTPPLP